jgi:peptide/nickel transport system substrate-binding protein
MAGLSKSDSLLVTRRRLLQGALAAGVLGALAACSDGGAAATSGTGNATSGSGKAAAGGGKALDTVNWSFNRPALALDPIKAGDLASEMSIASSVQGLVVYDATGAIKPYLAKSWTTPDPTTYVFQIRENVPFWDGSIMTMEDVMYSIDRIQNGDGTIFGGLFNKDSISSVTQTGEMEVTFKLPAANPEFLGLCNFFLIGQKKYTQAHESSLGTPGTLGMYTGPYIMTEFVPNQSLTMKSFDNYWGSPKGSAKTVTVNYITDDNTRMVGLQSGQLDGAFSVAPANARPWSQIKDIEVQVKPNLQVGYISMDVTQAPWSDIHVRRAVAMCCDTEGIVKSIMNGIPEAANAITPADEWASLGLTADQAAAKYATFTQYKFDIAAAKAELAKSSVPNGFTAELPVPPAPAELPLIAQSLSQNLKQIGITLNIKQVQDTEYRSGWFTQKKNTGIQLVENGPTVNDPADFPSIMLGKNAIVAGGFNSANFIDAKAEELIASQATLTDKAARADALMQLLAIAQDQVPYVMLFWNKGVMALNKSKVQYTGFHPSWYCIQPWASFISGV